MCSHIAGLRHLTGIRCVAVLGCVLAAATTGAGTMENPMAGTMDVELKNAATSSYFVGSDGRFLGAESQSDGKSLVRTPMAPDPIPVTIKQTITISVAK